MLYYSEEYSPMQINLPARPPFSLRSVVHSHGWIQMMPFQESENAAGFSYIDRLYNEAVVEVSIQEAPSGVRVRTEDDLEQAQLEELSGKVSWMLGLDQDFTEFYATAASEPKLIPAVNEAKGRILRSPTVFEDVVKTILTTNTLWAATIRMNNKLVEQFGASLPSDPVRKAFPTPEKLAETDEATLRTAVRLGYRSPYILELAHSVASGDLDLESLKTRRLSTGELRKLLLTIKGVGDYAAANLLMILGHYDYIPVDSWALKSVSQEWYAGEPVGRKEVEAAFNKWGNWKGLAYWMWDWDD